jgi:hypothetical protein
MQRELRLRIDEQDFTTRLGGVSSEKRGLATWEVSLTLLQARDLRDAFLAGRKIDESFEQTPGRVGFPDGSTFDTCRVNIIKDPQDWSRIWVDYVAPGEDPDYPREDVLAAELDDALASRLGRIWQLWFEGVREPEQIALSVAAGFEPGEALTFLSEPTITDFEERARTLAGLRDELVMKVEDGWLRLV